MQPYLCLTCCGNASNEDYLAGGGSISTTLVLELWHMPITSVLITRIIEVVIDYFRSLQALDVLILSCVVAR